MKRLKLRGDAQVTQRPAVIITTSQPIWLYASVIVQVCVSLTYLGFDWRLFVSLV